MRAANGCCFTADQPKWLLFDLPIFVKKKKKKKKTQNPNPPPTTDSFYNFPS